MHLTVEFDRETDGRHIAEVLELPGCLAYGRSRTEVESLVRALALHILADQVTSGERDPDDIADLLFDWSATKARRVLAALKRIGWSENSNRSLEREGWGSYTFSFHDDQEIGPVMLAKIAQRTGLIPEDL
jgi:predicted RNase H-like HicB family nuclease